MLFTGQYHSRCGVCQPGFRGWSLPKRALSAYNDLRRLHYYPGGPVTDRAILFLFSVVVEIASLAAAGWLLATGQAGTVDGLFLLLTCLLVALAFGLYLVFMVRRAMEPAPKPAAQTAKAGAGAQPQRKPAPVAQA